MNELRSALPRLRIPFIVAGILIALFLLAPILVILPVAFTTGTFLKFPPPGFTGGWFREVITDPQWIHPAWLSVRLAFLDTVFATVAGAAAAFAVRRMRKGTSLARTILLAPIVVPQLVLALGIYLAYRVIHWNGDLRILVIGQSTVAISIVFVTVSAGLASVDPALSRAAESLGHRWYSVVFRVELPLVARSIAAAAVMAFALSFDESVLAYFLSPAGQPTLPVAIWQSASQSASPAISAVSAYVMIIAVTLLAITAVLLGGRVGRKKART
jgi:putative spermidine/putrescine transport system permease protein